MAEQRERGSLAEVGVHSVTIPIEPLRSDREMFQEPVP
jgi:hypothetical protein